MDSAPLPPHERTWRHPSEMGASMVEVETGTPHRGLALAGGTLAVVLVAALVITFTPRQSTSTTTAITATTVPTASSLRDTANSAVAAAESIRNSSLASVNAIPSAIVDVPSAAFRSASIGGDARAVLPDLDDRVTVLTEQYAYAVAWRDVARLDLSADAIVVDREGSIVARITDDRLIVSHDLLVGASVTVD